MFRIGSRGLGRMFDGLASQLAKIEASFGRIETHMARLNRLGGGPSGPVGNAYGQAFRSMGPMMTNRAMSGGSAGGGGAHDSILLQQILHSVRMFDSNMGRAMSLLLTGRVSGSAPASGGGSFPVAGAAALGLATGSIGAFRPGGSANLAAGARECMCREELRRLNAVALTILRSMKTGSIAPAAAPVASPPATPPSRPAPLPRGPSWEKTMRGVGDSLGQTRTTAPAAIHQADAIFRANRRAAALSRGSSRPLSEEQQLAALMKDIKGATGVDLGFAGEIEKNRAMAIAASGHISRALATAKKTAPGLSTFLASNPLSEITVFDKAFRSTGGRMAKGDYLASKNRIRFAASELNERTVLHEIGHHLRAKMGKPLQEKWEGIYQNLPGASKSAEKEYSTWQSEAFSEAVARFVMGKKGYEGAAFKHPLIGRPEMSSIFTKKGALNPKVSGFLKELLGGGGDVSELMPAGDGRKRRYAKVPTGVELAQQYFSMLDSWSARAKGGDDIRGEANLIAHLQRNAAKGGRQSERFKALLRYGLRRQQGSVVAPLHPSAAIGEDEPWKGYQSRLQRFVDAAGGDEALGRERMHAHMQRVMQLGRRNSVRYRRMMDTVGSDAQSPSVYQGPVFGDWSGGVRGINSAEEAANGRRRYSLSAMTDDQYVASEWARLGPYGGLPSNEYDRRKQFSDKMWSRLTRPFVGGYQAVRKLFNRKGNDAAELMPAGNPNDPWDFLNNAPSSGGKSPFDKIQQSIRVAGRLAERAFQPMLLTAKLIAAELDKANTLLAAMGSGGGGSGGRGGSRPPRVRPIPQSTLDSILDGMQRTGRNRNTSFMKGKTLVQRRVEEWESSNGAKVNVTYGPKGAERTVFTRKPVVEKPDKYFAKVAEYHKQQNFLQDYLKGATLLSESQTPSKNQYMRTNQVYRMADGRVATYTNDPGRMTASVRMKAGDDGVSQLPSMWRRFVSGVQSSSGVIRRSLDMAFAPARMIERAGRGIGDMAIRLSALHYSLTRIGRGVGGLTLGPIDRVIDATEEARTFERSVSGVVGGPIRARAFDAALYNFGNTNNTPLTRTELRDTAREMALIPQLAPQLAAGSPEQAAAAAGRFSSLTQALGELDPAQGVRGALVAIREGLSGDLRSTRLRLEISPDVLASLVGKTQRDLTSDPELFLKSLERYREIYLPQSSVAERANTVGFQKQRMADQMNRALETVGQSGLFDQITSRMKAAADVMFSYFNSPDFMAKAGEISGSMGRVFDGVTGSVLEFTRQITGIRDIKDLPSGVVESIKVVLSSMAEFAEKAPEMGARMGQFFQDFTGNFSAMLEWVAGGNSLLQKINILPTGDEVRAIRQRQAAEADAANQKAALIRSLQAAPNERIAERVAQIEKRRSDWAAGSREWDAKTRSTHALLDNDVFWWMQQDAEGKRYAEIWGQDPERVRQKYLQSNFLDDPRKMGAYPAFPAASETDRLYEAEYARRKSLTADEREVMSEAFMNRINRKFTPSSAAAAAMTAINPDVLKFVQSGKAFDPAGGGPNAYGALFTPIAGNAQRIGEGYNQDQDRLYAVVQSATSRINSIIDDGLIEAIDKRFAADMESLKIAMADAGLQALSGDALAKEQLRNLAGAAGYIHNQYNQQRSSTIDALAASGRNYGMAYAQSLNSESAMMRSIGYQQVMSGSAPGQQRLASALARLSGSPVSFALDTLPMHEQAPLVRNRIDADMQMRAGFYAPYDSSMSADQILSRRRLTDHQSARQQLEYLKTQAVPTMSGVHARASELLRQDPTNIDALRSVGASAEMLDNYMEQMRRLELQIDDIGAAWNNFQTDIRSATENGFGRAISSMIKGTGDLRDVMTGFADDVVNAFSRMAASNFTNLLFGQFGTPQQGGGVGGMGGIFGSLIGSLFSGGTAAAANGAVWPGFRAFANGGTTTGPVLGLVGEGGRREGMVPLNGRGRIPTSIRGGRVFADLPDGRVIPSDAVVGGAGGVVVNSHTIVVSSQSEAQAEADRLRSMDPEAVINVVTNDIARGGRISKAMRRKG